MLCGLLLALAPQVGLADELTPAFPDRAFADAAPAAVETGSPRQWNSDTAIGMTTALHIFVSAADGEAVTVTALGEESRTRDLAFFRLHAVPVEENTGLTSRTEQFEGKENPHVIRRAPFWVFDPIEPLLMEARKNQLQGGARAAQGGVAFRVEWTPQASGRQTLPLVIRGANGSEQVHWEVQIHDLRMPPRADWGVHYTNWFSPQQIATRHQVELWSADFWPVLRQYAHLMARGGQDTFWLRWQDFFAKNDEGQWQLDRDRLERYVTTFLSEGLHWIEGAPIARRPGGDWSSPTLELVFDGVPANSPEGKQLFRHLAGQMRGAFRTEDWSRQWIQHIADEPTDVNAEDYKGIAKQLRQHLKGVPIVEATMTRELVDAIDIWCPQVQKFQANREFFAARQAAGDQVWTYTCLVPGGPWLNRLLDQERLRPVYIGWAAAHFGTSGFLHWGLNHYKTEDPFATSVVDHPAQPNTTNKLPAGDTHLVYPGPAGPWSSTRFEAHRIGLEDAALLRMLQAADPETAGAIITQVFRGYDDWEASVEQYRKARSDVFRALAGLE